MDDQSIALEAILRQRAEELLASTPSWRADSLLDVPRRISGNRQLLRQQTHSRVSTRSIPEEDLPEAVVLEADSATLRRADQLYAKALRFAAEELKMGQPQTAGEGKPMIQADSALDMVFEKEDFELTTKVVERLRRDQHGRESMQRYVEAQQRRALLLRVQTQNELLTRASSRNMSRETDLISDQNYLWNRPLTRPLLVEPERSDLPTAHRMCPCPP